MLRILAVGSFAALALYYARAFVVLHQEASTLAQIGVLLLAALVVVAPSRATAWRVTTFQAWLVSLAALCLSAVIFAWADQSSHSVSDTLNRSVPLIVLVITVAARSALPSGRAPAATAGG